MLNQALLSNRFRLPFTPNPRALLLLLAYVGLVWVTLNLTTARSDTPAIDSTPAGVAHAGPGLFTSPTADVPAAERLVLVEPEAWDAVTRTNVERALALLPASVRQDLGNPELGPLLIHVSPDGRTLSGRQPYGGPANYYSTNEGINEVVIHPGQSVLTILHELGHAYNLRRLPGGAYAQVFLDPEMRSFMATAGWRVNTATDDLARMVDHTRVALAYGGPTVWTNLSREDPLEDFANSFAMYFAAPRELQALSPQRHSWLEALFGAN
jgi:hypothetical protein